MSKKNYVKLNETNLDNVLQPASKHSYVLLGESTHGTDEYFSIRLKLTKDMIRKHRYSVVLFETEWSLGYEINKYIHRTIDEDPVKLLNKLSKKYPRWILYNKYVLDLMKFLREWNDTHAKKVYFYGIDCQDINIARKNMCHEKNLNCDIVNDIIKNYKNMASSSKYWDIRDSFWFHIINMINADSKMKTPAKFILWAHNSHIGNINANKNNHNTVNIASLLEAIYDIYNIGFSTYNGTVRASTRWNSPSKIFKLNPAIKTSYEYDFHKICIAKKWPGIIYRTNKAPLNMTYKQFRYIGVVYVPSSEKSSHYQLTNLNHEYDVVIFIDKTSALPLLTE